MIRVAVTTDRFIETAPAFNRVGLEPVSLPCIRIERAEPAVVAAAREAASTADLLLVSSVRTLDVLWPNGSMPTVDVAAVGERTATAVEACGGRVWLIGRAGLTDLVQRAADRIASSRVVFAHAAGSDPAATEFMAQGAADFHTFEVYRTIPMAPSLTPVEAAAFASPSAVAGWLLTRRLDDLVVGVIGPTTWDAAARHRLPDVMASRSSHQALAEALASYLEVTL